MGPFKGEKIWQNDVLLVRTLLCKHKMRKRLGRKKDGAWDAGSAELIYCMHFYTWHLLPFESVPGFAPE